MAEVACCRATSGGLRGLRADIVGSPAARYRPGVTSCLRDEDVLELLAGAIRPGLETARAHLEICELCQVMVALASPPTRAIQEGDILLDRYRVVSEIGRGGMGIVYRVHDPKLHRDLAIKVLLSVDPNAPARMEREARSLARLSHPNIVTVFDVGTLAPHEDDASLARGADPLCMVMELVEGCSLRAWLAEPRPRAAILAVFRQAAEGLVAAHCADLVHRDFKPENVLVGNDGRVKIVDFGLAAVDLVPDGGSAESCALAPTTPLHRLTRTGLVVGTPAYMAPEQFGGGEPDARSDQFAFAVCLWEALAGTHPFAAANVGELREHLARGPRVANGADTLREDPAFSTLTQALAVHPEQRFASMADLLAALSSDVPPPSRVARWGWTAAAAGLAIAGSAFGLSRLPRAVSTVADGVRGAPSSVVSREGELAAPVLPSLAAASPPSNTSVAVVDADRLSSGPSPVAPPPRRIRAVGARMEPSRAESVPSPTKDPARGPNGAPLIE